MENLISGIFRIKVPFEDLFTTVYVYKSDDGVALIDSATYSTDVDNYIIPALKEAEISFQEVKYLLFTHEHGDHFGGSIRLKEVFSDATVATSFETDIFNKKTIVDGEIIIGNLQAVLLPGHTTNSVGFLDLMTKTLLSGDCLQLAGVGKYRYGIGYPELYLKSIEKLKNMDIERIVAAHEYDPLGSIADGKDEVRIYLDKCAKICKEIKNESNSCSAIILYG